MAIVSILFSCFLGLVIGLADLIVYSESLWQAFMTYATVSAVLSAMFICAAALSARVNRPIVAGPARRAQLEAWREWQTEEEKTAERAEDSAQAKARARTERHTT